MNRFPNLDSIRTLAFLSTFLAHAFHAENDKILNSIWYQQAIGFHEFFSFGVPLFFVLSGFLISYLMIQEQERSGEFNLKNFYARRILRIWPVYFLTLSVGFIFFPLFRTFFLKLPYVATEDPLYYLFFLSNFDQINKETLPFGVGLGPTWSVSVEEQYYLLWPVLILLFQRRNFIYPIIMVIVSSLFLTYFYSLSSKHTIYCMIYLSVGGFFAFLSYYHLPVVLKITNLPSVVFIGSVIALLLLIQLYIQSGSSFLIIFLIAVIIGYIIIYQCYSNRCSLKKLPFLESLGKYTYGLYLYHVICIFIIHIIIDDILKFQETIALTLLIRPALSLALSSAVSYLSYHYMESHFLSFKNKFSPAYSQS